MPIESVVSSLDFDAMDADSKRISVSDLTVDVVDDVESGHPMGLVGRSVLVD